MCWRRVRSEGDINEVVAGLEGVGREEAGGAVPAVSIDAGVRGRGQRAVGIGGREVVSGVRIISSRMVGGNIGGAGGYGHRRGKCHRLPAGCTRVAEGSLGKQRPRRAPQVRNIRAGVPRGPVELDAGDRPCNRRRELDADFELFPIVGSQSRSIARREEALRCGRGR